MNPPQPACHQKQMRPAATMSLGTGFAARNEWWARGGCGNMHGQGKSCSASSMASRSASASLSSIHCVGFQPIFPSARTYRIASPACSNSERTSETRACRPLGVVWAFLCSHATFTQNFSFFVIRNFISSFVPATESLSQISVFRIGRPRHAPTVTRACSNLEAPCCTKPARFCYLRCFPGAFLLTDLPKTNAVKCSHRYTNLRSTSQVHTSPYWDCICIRANETRWGTADNERPCYTSTWTERIKAARYMYRFCQNGQQLLGYWLRWGTQFSNAFDLIHSGPS
jgi:hypothetical protein